MGNDKIRKVLLKLYDLRSTINMDTATPGELARYDEARYDLLEELEAVCRQVVK